MAYRQLLTDEERHALLGIPLDPDGMARCFTLLPVTPRFTADVLPSLFADEGGASRYSGETLFRSQAVRCSKSNVPASWRPKMNLCVGRALAVIRPPLMARKV